MFSNINETIGKNSSKATKIEMTFPMMSILYSETLWRLNQSNSSPPNIPKSSAAIRLSRLSISITPLNGYVIPRIEHTIIRTIAGIPVYTHSGTTNLPNQSSCVGEIFSTTPPTQTIDKITFPINIDIKIRLTISMIFSPKFEILPTVDEHIYCMNSNWEANHVKEEKLNELFNLLDGLV